MTEQIVSEKSQHLAQALLLEQVAFYKNQLTTQLSAEFFQQFIQLFIRIAVKPRDLARGYKAAIR
ncbi:MULTISPECIES: hypothetical protein [Acinetobacter]|uniref:Uncharacterized protein n=1 Tax=Acinetobacter parvus DSM 16617 = CIP 108168 TaxID=981333 RepID=N8RKF4_9GAMM|nr:MULTISPECIES: hypothetical protein [Acinetobacter]ENU35888.1 hypothetical protein F988_02070 [Acinetobacter parvus DSM 16617 = CIP 108168]ENU83127.1 hypothetical protein F974_01787 [Acinetobacter sp. CIP 102159]ENU88853.1 hypothetical protein F972_01944 [Acinetobacter sp. CIP 102529]ENU96133.1 hypothetical protein F970_01237 [Acinetobacter sp. CIP 102082]ENX61785.1 hypothetical protein F884_02627 [Acinetobacter sp. CIP 102143]